MNLHIALHPEFLLLSPMACSFTDAALSWLLSLSATCTSSPLRPSSPPDYNNSFTDWLQISPSPPPQALQDISSSARVNILQEQDNLGLTNHYAFSDLSDVSQAAGTSDTFSDTLVSLSTTSICTEASFNQHNRMLSLDSSSATLVSSPSPCSLALLSPPFSTQYHQSSQLQISSPSYHSPPPILSSPASKLIQEFSNSPFGSYYYDASTAIHPFASQSISDVSPVVRAEKITGRPTTVDRQTAKPKKKARKQTRRDSRTSSFVEKLSSAPSPVAALPVTSPVGIPNSNIALLSPVKISDPPSLTPRSLEKADVSPSQKTNAIAGQVSIPKIPAPVFTTPPPRSPVDLNDLSPLTPILSPANARSTHCPLKIKITVKRKNDFSTPVRRSKRPRRALIIDSSSPIDSDNEPSTTAAVFQAVQVRPDDRSLLQNHANRKLPANIQISPNFPLFYRRFPASGYYQPSESEYSHSNYVYGSMLNWNDRIALLVLFLTSLTLAGIITPLGACSTSTLPASSKGKVVKRWVCVLFALSPSVGVAKIRSFGWLWNSLLISGRLFTRIFDGPPMLNTYVKSFPGKGLRWFSLTFGSYHMQYSHGKWHLSVQGLSRLSLLGISASTGKPFSPPLVFRIVPRINPGKKEKHQIQQGKCHKCCKWVNVEGIKDMESKVWDTSSFVYPPTLTFLVWVGSGASLACLNFNILFPFWCPIFTGGSMLLLVTMTPPLKVKETTTTRVTISTTSFPLSKTLEFLRQRFAKMIQLLYIKFSVVFCQVCCYLMPSTLTSAFSVFCFVISL